MPNVNPEVLRWARERAASLDIGKLLIRFPELSAWEQGHAHPTLKQLEDFARVVRVPFGYLFLPTPPDDPLPIPDFRTHEGRGVSKASPDLLDMLYVCQERQDWYSAFVQAEHLPEAAFVGSASLRDKPEDIATRMTQALAFDVATRAALPSLDKALSAFIRQADRLGVLVMVSGIVLSNTHRKLNPEEFRGFAFADKRAPLVFINGADTKSAQMFTLAHELAHLWLGASALSDADALPFKAYRREEVWCNAVAAEFLIPLVSLRAEWRVDEPLEQALVRLTRHFKVSAFVVLRRLFDAGIIDRPGFDRALVEECARLREPAKTGGGGGDFCRTTVSRVGRRFARALVESTLEGRTLYRDAFRMLGVSNTETFNTIGHKAELMG